MCLQVAKAPHHDLSGAEVEAGVRLSEHLLHLQRTQRRSLSAAAARHAQLAGLAAGLAALADAPAGLPLQVTCHTPFATLEFQARSGLLQRL